MNKYQIIYADPPWQYRQNGGNRGSACKYAVMDAAAIAALPVASIAAPDCLLAMWWVGPQPEEALAVMKGWGFTLKTMKGFTWHKETAGGLSAFGMGHWTRANTEDCLFAVRGKPKRIHAGVSQFITRARREHSRKPDAVREALVKLMGDIPRIELFARARAPGWDAWGNECPDSVKLEGF